MICAELSPRSTILDLGCGAGRIANPLAMAGFAVTGVDNSPEMLVALDGVEPVLSSIEDLDLGRRFDAIILASYLLNIPSVLGRKRLLRSCRRHMHDGGLAFIQARGRSLLEDLQGRVVDREGVRDSYEVWRRIDDQVTFTIRTEWRGRVWTQTATHQYLSPEVIESELNNSGLTLMRPLTIPEWFLVGPN